MRSTPEQREYREKLRERIHELSKSGKSHVEIAKEFTRQKVKRLSGNGTSWTNQDIGYLLYQADGRVKGRSTMPAVSPPTSDLEALMREVLESNMATTAKTDLMKILLSRS